MSCQQVSRLIPTTTATSVSPEDPYVFTETVPTTPPTLFNTQKARSRIVQDNTQLTAAIIKAPSPLGVRANAKLKANQKLPLAPLNGNNAKTQASSAGNIPVASGITETVATKLTLPFDTALKNTSQSQQLQKQQNQQQQQHQSQQSQQQTKKASNVCIVRPQQKQQQSRYQTARQNNKLQNQKQTSPPPLLQHTPSLWQTPLLLDTSSTVISPPTSPASTISPAPKISIPIAASVTAATAMVSPLINTAAVSTLPPSKFHHTTLAQHLQKVQCIKKPKKLITNNTKQQLQIQEQQPSDVGGKILVVQPSAVLSQGAPPPLQAIEPAQHSDSDLNDIPVNVIFRKPQTNEATQSANSGSAENGSSIADATTDSVRCSNDERGPRKSIKANGRNVAPTQRTVQRACAVPAATTIKPQIATSEPGLMNCNLNPAPSVLRDIVFVHRNVKAAHVNDSLISLPQPLNPNQDTSSMAMHMSTNDLPLSCQPVRKQTIANQSKCEKYCAKDTLKTGVSAKPISATKNAYKRKAPATSSVLTKSNNALHPFSQKRSRKLGVLFPISDSNSVYNSPAYTAHIGSNSKGSSRAVAVIKMTAAEVDADTTLLASATVLPYCIQQHWLNVYSGLRAKVMLSKNTSNCGLLTVPATDREDRISRHKKLLRRQALQLLSTHSMQKLPLQIAKRRLLCVDRLLRKYKDHNEIESSFIIKRCDVSGCVNRVLEMASHCQEHIAHNAAQHIFLPCTAKFADNTQCRIPVFDITHDLPLCAEHVRKRDAYNRSMNENRPCKVATAKQSLDYNGEELFLQLQQFHQSRPIDHEQLQLQQKEKQKQLAIESNYVADKYKKLNNTKAIPARKRKVASTNMVGRPQKRVKKVGVATPIATKGLTTTAPLQLSSAVLQRKSSTTSLESIASNSQSSNSQPHYVSNISPVGSLVMPALAPLSGHNALCNTGGSSTVSNTSHRMLHFGNAALLHDDIDNDMKAHEINQIVAQFPMVANNNNNEKSNNNYSGNSSSMNFICTNSDSNFTSGLGSTSSIPSTEELLRQELLSACENSSAYASSEDTGLGGLSETELMAGTHDADDIPLGDTRLLEEHDLANVLSALPEDAFSELFTAVHQDERDEVERALELADKHLKSLQQTIGSSIDFLSDFPDDEILADNDMCNKMGIVSSMMHSPDTSGIDTSTLFIDGGSNSAVGGGATANNCPAVVDIRGLVQT